MMQVGVIPVRSDLQMEFFSVNKVLEIETQHSLTKEKGTLFHPKFWRSIYI